MSDTSDISERIESVATTSADGEQLVSVAVSTDEPIGEKRRAVREDVAEAEYLNVHEEVRKPLRRAVEAVKDSLDEYEETPENGLAVYAGVVGTDLVTYVFDDLPNPIRTGTYEYANEFDTTPLAANTEGTDTHGLLIVARESAVVATYDGEAIETLETVESDVPSKQAAEGRKEDRFQGRSEERAKEFFAAVGTAAERAFLKTGTDTREPAVEGVILGGSEVMGERFLDEDVLPEPLDDEIVGPFTVEYASETGLRRLVDEASAADAFDDTEARETLDRLFDALDGDEPAVGGLDDVERALEHDAVETLVVADSVRPSVAQSLQKRTEEADGDCVVVPSDFERAERLEEAFDGVGALLRFRIA
jgi:peptide chain release factor 1